MSLRDLVEKAIKDLDLYRHPNVAFVKSQLHAIMVAADIGTCGADDQIDRLDISDGFVHVRVVWSAWGCEQSGDYEFPEGILDAEDPVLMATFYGLHNKIAHHKEMQASAEREAVRYAEAVVKYEKQLEELRAKNKQA